MEVAVVAEDVDLNDLITKAGAAELCGITRASMQDRINARPERYDIVDIGGVPFLKRSQVLAADAEVKRERRSKRDKVA